MRLWENLQFGHGCETLEGENWVKMVLTLFYVSLEPVINVSGRFFSKITSSQKIQTHKQNNQSLSYSNDYGVSCCLSLYFGSHTSCTTEKQPLFRSHHTQQKTSGYVPLKTLLLSVSPPRERIEGALDFLA